MSVKFKGFNYEIDSSLLKTEVDGEIRPVYIFARNQKELQVFLKTLKANHDKGTLKILKRVSGKVHSQYESWTDLYFDELMYLTGVITSNREM
jgi:hypothetical protein